MAAADLFKYLSALSKLRRGKPTYDLSNYDKVFWLSEIPKEKGCFNLAWGSDDKTASERWIEVKRQNKPKFPEPPDNCKPWIIEEELSDPSKAPLIKSEIKAEVGKDESANINNESLKLENCPDIEKAWKNYLERQWRPWSEEYRRWQKIQKVFDELFAFHQAMKNLEEQYEIVLGLGFLTWKPDDKRNIKRHLLSARATIEFDADQAILSVQPASDGARLTLEDEVFLPNEVPQDVRNDIRNDVFNISENPWDINLVNSIVRRWVQSLHPQGRYSDSIEKHKVFGEIPEATFAPALLLRKCSTKPFEDVCEKIIINGSLHFSVDLRHGERPPGS